MEKRKNSPLFHNIFYLLLDVHIKAGTRFSLRDKQLFKISEVEIAKVNCICEYMRFTVMFRSQGKERLRRPNIYSRLSLSRIPRDSIKYFEMSVPRHIRFAELRKKNSNNHI